MSGRWSASTSTSTDRRSCEDRAMMILDYPTRFVSRAFAATVSLLGLAMLTIAPAAAVDVPDDHAQDALIRSTLTRFNDANMTNDYSVFMAKASQQLQTQVPL